MNKLIYLKNTFFIIPLIILSYSLNSCSSKKETDSREENMLASVPVDEALIASSSFDETYDWDSLAPKTASKFPSFTIFKLNGEQFDLYTELQKGRPILLISGSYTCDITRSWLPDIDELTQLYQDHLDVYMIYVVEAHPVDAASPYSKKHKIWIVEKNIEDSIETKRPTTYLERKNLGKQWIDRFNIKSELLIDNPNNVCWVSFGRKPNMAYLIKPDQILYARQKWFERESLEKEIKNLLRDLKKG